MQARFFYEREQRNKLEYSITHGINVSLHFHSAVELQLVLEGKLEVWINDRRKVLGPGEISVAFSYDAHAYRSLENAVTASMIVPVGECGAFFAALGDKRPGNPFIKDPVAFEKMLACHRAMKESTNSLQERGYLSVFLGILLECLPLERAEKNKDPDLSTRILLFLNENYKKELTLSDLATALGYNPNYLSRFFKANFHISLSRYLSMLRLREAVLLMNEPKNTVAYCAYESGFPSIRTFYRAFTEEFHCTPKEYRAARERN